MSNEELAARIQDGQTELFGELWEQVRRWVVCVARRRLPSDGSTNKIELEDLIQAGYVALVEAVKAFDRESGNGFLSYLNNHLKGAFAAELGYRTTRRDALRSADSLDRPIPGSDGIPLVSVMPDIDAEQEIFDIEERLTVETDFERLMIEVDKLGDQAQDIIKRHYIDGQSPAAIGEALGLTAQQVKQYERRAFKNLRHRGAVRRMAKNYADNRTSVYRFKSVQAFNSSRSSVVEDVAELRDYLTGEYISRYDPETP